MFWLELQDATAAARETRPKAAAGSTLRPQRRWQAGSRRFLETQRLHVAVAFW